MASVRMQVGERSMGELWDEDGEPLVGASVVVKGTTAGALTNEEGYFRLHIPPDADPMLAISYVGYIHQQIDVRQTDYTEAVMNSDLTLEEVIVTGYSTSKKKSVTGAISTVSTQTLTGKVVGVSMISDSMISGIRIRGSRTIAETNPMILIDGQPYEGSMDDLDLDKIRTVNVLQSQGSGRHIWQQSRQWCHPDRHQKCPPTARCDCRRLGRTSDSASRSLLPS